MEPIKTISSRTAFACPWYQVRVSQIELPNGEQGEYNVVDVPPCAFVVPVTAANEIILIHQFRYPNGKWVWEVPAGAIHKDETILESAQTELREEVGGTSNEWTYLGQFQTANGRSNEVAHLYLAQNVVMSGETAHEAAEVITVHPTPIERVKQMVYRNEIEDAPSALAILLALPYIEKTKGEKMKAITIQIDPYSGTLLWSRNEEANQTYGGYPIDHDKLPVSTDLRAELNRLVMIYDNHFPLDDPGGGIMSWNEATKQAFWRDLKAVVEQLRQELGADHSLYVNYRIEDYE